MLDEPHRPVKFVARFVARDPRFGRVVPARAVPLPRSTGGRSRRA